LKISKDELTLVNDDALSKFYSGIKSQTQTRHKKSAGMSIILKMGIFNQENICNRNAILHGTEKTQIQIRLHKLWFIVSWCGKIKKWNHDVSVLLAIKSWFKNY